MSSEFPVNKKQRTMEDKTKMTEKTTGQVGELDAQALNRFSRQNAALGAETTAKLIKTKVLLYGLRGVGVEVAKNLLLQGVGGLTVIDSRPTLAKDVGVNFFLTEEDAERKVPRADAVAPRLRELNPMCSVVVAASLSEEVISMHSALVIADNAMPRAELERLNLICRSRNISFFYNFTGGLSTSIFVDHGDNHVVTDKDGERPMQKILTGITRVQGGDNEVLLRYDTPEGQKLDTIDSGHFELSGVQGLSELNGTILEMSHPHGDPVKTCRAKLAGRAAAVDVSAYAGGGVLTEKKMPAPFGMSPLADKIKSPGNPFMGDLVLTDLLNFGSELQQHAALVGLWAFAAANDGRLPRLHDTEDAAAVVEAAKAELSSGALAMDDFELDEAQCTRFAMTASVELQPLSAFTGGVLAQEVVKLTGKFTPIPGWLHFTAAEARPTETPADFSPRDTRYDELAAVYGWPFVEKLGALQYFMVGCGALGCEFFKNFALNGICCGAKGKLIVTDADRIELSNLSRQFLFREHNVGQPKSRAAGAMASQMNPGLKVQSLEMFVGPKTEDTFDDPFWMKLDGVCNALDNMEARNYVDAQCVKYELPLLESGTMGTSGNVDTIVPFKTRTYRDGGNAAEGGGVPMCTLRNFPHLTDHCIEWARDQFELLFVKLPGSTAKYAESPTEYEAEKRTLAEAEPGQALFEARCVLSLLRAAKTPSVGAAAQVAFDLFHFLFRDKILDLQVRTFAPS
jgi:ubiquitin-activating enzyme E1